MRIVFANATTSINTDAGYPMLVVQGTHWPADDPIVKQHPDLFSNDPRYGLVFTTEPYVDDSRPVVVEQATAAPGEVRRGPGRPRKSA